MVIRVADTGIGIDADELPHVFEPYYRGHVARESGVTGAGIGIGRSCVRIVWTTAAACRWTPNPGVGTTG